MSCPLIFFQENWKPDVSFLVGNRVDDYKHIDILSATINTGIRKLFTVVTKDSLYNEVRELGNPKVKKGKDAPLNFEICEPCKTHLDAGEDIPLPLLAKLIKYRLLTLKAADIKRREAEKKAAADKLKAAKDKAAGKDAGRKPSGKKGGKKTPEPQAAKDGSKLKKRGEDDGENKFIDDEPDDGAHMYVVVVGFNNPNLLQFLADLNVTASCIIRITSQDYSRFLPPPPLPDAPEKDEKTLAAEEAVRVERQKLALELRTFWKDVLHLLRNNPDSSKLHDIARLDYEVKSLLLPSNYDDIEQKTQFGTAMFEDVACMIYDLQDARRLYNTYLQNLKLVSVPMTVSDKTVEKPSGDGQSTGAPPTPAAPLPPTSSASQVLESSIPELVVPPDMRCYNDMMNSVPQESMSVCLVLHCMMEQVVATEENREPPSEQTPQPRVDGLSGQVAEHLSGIAFKLALSEDEHKALSEVLELPVRPPEEPKPPLLINMHDDISIRTHHLTPYYDFNPEATERALLKMMPIAQLCQSARPTSAVARARAARLQELIHFCATNGLSPAEIDRAFKQFVFECQDLAATDPNGFIVTRDIEGLEHTPIPWDDPYPFFKGMIPHELKELEILETPSEERSGAKSPGPLEVASQIVDTERSEKKGDRSQSPSPARSGSADSRKGILRSPSRSAPNSPHRSRSNSCVHFEVPEGHKFAMEEAADAVLSKQESEEVVKSVEDSLMEVVEAQQRILDQWCFAEHYEPHVLLQVLREASYVLPFIETYEHKRDQSVMLVLHNPYNPELQNHIDWHTELHSNVGFRNYLEYVAESIAEWLKEKEAEYQAHLLQQEVEKIRQDDEVEAKVAGGKDKRGKSPRKSARSKSPKSSRPSSAESARTNPYIREGSLKAWKEEQDRLKAEEDEKESLKNQKRAKSAQKKEEKEKEEKKPQSRGSAKSRTPEPHTEDQQQQDVIPEDLEPYWPFTGYDTGNLLLHASGILTTLFPSDGGQIRTERTEFVQGSTTVKTTVLKDGHVFAVHIVNPREEPEEEYDPDLDPSGTAAKAEATEKADLEKPEKEMSQSESAERTAEEDGEKKEEEKDKKPLPVSQFGSIAATLCDGMVISLSQWGATGETAEGKPYEPAPYVPPASSPSPQPQTASPTKGKKDKKGAQPTPEPPPVEEEPQVVETPEEILFEQPFQEVFVTCPDGLNVRYFLQSSVGVNPESPEDRHLVVKQSYPFKTAGLQDCEAIRRKYIASEASRITTADGTVVKNMVDGSVEVLYADGTVAVHTGNWVRSSSSRTSSPQRPASARSQTERVETPTKKEKGRSAGKGKPATEKPPEPIAAAPPPEVEEEEVKRGTWVVTCPSGERWRTNPDGTSEKLKNVMLCLASDPDTKQTMSTRDDHVITVSYPDGTTVVEHGDGTRITTYYRDTQVPVGDENDETGEPVDVITQTLKFVKVECPAYATVEFNCASSENLTVFGSGTSINVFPDGYYILHHARGGRIEVDTEGTLSYYPRPNKNMELLVPERELQYVMRHNADVICETVDPEGNVFNIKCSGDFCVLPVAAGDELSDNSDEPRQGEKKLARYGHHAPRFFIVHADGSGTELLRYQDIAEYLTSAERNPATAVLKEPLPEYPGVVGMTILKPYIGGVSDRWFKKYDQPSIIPNGIRSRDLTTLPPKEYKKPGAKFGTNVGQGLSVGGAVKMQQRIPILKCPSALELRQFVQYKPMNEQLRAKLRQGLKEYAEYVMERNRMQDLMAVTDPRSEDEKILAADLLNNAMAQRPEPPPVESDYIKDVYEQAIAPPPPSPPPTPQPKRTQADWERDARELAEEADGRSMLRSKKIPSYFDSELGKAFLLTQAKDMDELLKELSEDPRRDGTEAVRADTSERQYSRMDVEPSPAPTRQLQSQPGLSQMSDRSTGSGSPATMARSKLAPETPLSYAGGAMSEVAAMTPSGVRPGNPTPAHAAGQGSPALVRPKNPTPAMASKVVTDRPVNPTPKMAGGFAAETPSELDYMPGARGEYPMILEQPMEEERGVEFQETETDLLITQSLKTNVTGEPRTNPVPLPTSIMGGRPNAQPNMRYQQIEEPVRRHIKNTVVVGATDQGKVQIRRMQGLSAFPEEVNFGVLREGCTYAFLVQLKNTGVDSCRFKVRQPPPATGLRVIYRPGAVAAGMKAELRLELYAIAVGVEGESGVADEYDNRSQDSPTISRAPGVVLISNTPPASTGIIRPRKDLAIEAR
nr:hypothetical protein BaRGS_014235 [Batillaria attramentaria]